MKAVEEHWRDVMTLGDALPGRSVDLMEARGLVLAGPIDSHFSIPPFTNSAMDGFAVRAKDVVPGKRLPVRGESAAGSTDVPVLAPGTAIRIMTGAPLPEGADSILQVEFTENAGAMMLGAVPDSICPTQEVVLGQHVRREGEDISAEARVFEEGETLSSVHISALVAMGYSTAVVHQRPRVGILTAGAELRSYGEDIAPGQIPDSNGPLVAQLVEERGARGVRSTIHTDDVAEFTAELLALVEQTDMVITTGGVSAGAYDVVKAALLSRGITFEKVAMQPGKPQGWGSLKNSAGSVVPILCLPGNPVSVFVSMRLFGLPLLERMFGRPVASYDSMFRPERVGKGWSHKVGRTQFMPCRADTNGRIVPASVGGSGSHLIGSLPRATGLARLAADMPAANAGETIDVMWLRSEHAI